MPINRGGGRLGAGIGLAIPGYRFLRGEHFRSSNFSTHNATISGVTKDAAGVALDNCTVQLFRTVDDSFRSEVISDGAGNYLLYPDVTGPFYIVAYKVGSPDVSGTTVNTLTGA